MTLMMKGQWRITILLPSTIGWWLIPTLFRLTATGAIDINPLIDPYIVGNKVVPANAAEYADRDKAF